MKREQLDQIFSMLPRVFRPMVEMLVRMYEDHLAQRDVQISDLEARVRDLEGQLNQNSRNSSRPPSSDGPKKERLSKGKKGNSKKRPPGGQAGHPGNTLKMVAPEEVSKIENHYPSACEQCGEKLDQEVSQQYDRRQVFDIPPIEMEVTEHRAHWKQCSCCAHRSQGAFPQEATNNAVYGPNIRALGSYLMAYQILPHGRAAELLRDFIGSGPGVGTLDNILSEAATKLTGFGNQLREQLQQAAVAGFDETTIITGEGQRYAHVARTEQHTLYHLGRRDYATMDEMGVLPYFKGIAVHDRYTNYFGYDCEHSLCNAHLLRDLQGVIDRAIPDESITWAQGLQDLLRSMNKAVKRAREQGKSEFSDSHLAQYRQRFRYLVEQGLKDYPPEVLQSNSSNGKKSKAHNLLLALDNYTDEALCFLYNFNVPFDNNGAERDIRMLKVKMKTSGFFHSIETGNRFLQIRSFVSTARKQGYSAFDALRQLFSNEASELVFKLTAI